MKKKVNFKKIIISLVILVAFHFLLMSFSPNYMLLVSSVSKLFKGEYTTLSCGLAGGETINTLGDYRKCPSDGILGQVTGLMCPCVCCKKDPSNPKPTDKPYVSDEIYKMEETGQEKY